MDSSHLDDRIRWGLNVAARATGALTSAYRPRSRLYPLDEGNRFLRLQAAFTGPNGNFSQPNSYGNAVCHGIFDAAYTQPGDYLRQNAAVWFIAAQSRLLPVLCVRTNRIVTLSRSDVNGTSGASSYGGMTAACLAPLMTKWPASVLAMSREARPLAALPGDTMASYWNVLLPAFPGIILRTGDLMSDDLGRNGVIATTELSELGWRLAVRQATT